MEFLEVLLPVLLYSFGIVLVIVLIVLGLKAIETLNKMNALMDDMKEKIDTMNGFFHIMDMMTSKVSVITDTVVSAVTGTIQKMKRKKKKRKEMENYE